MRNSCLESPDLICRIPKALRFLQHVTCVHTMIAITPSAHSVQHKVHNCDSSLLFFSPVSRLVRWQPHHHNNATSSSHAVCFPESQPPTPCVSPAASPPTCVQWSPWRACVFAAGCADGRLCVCAASFAARVTIGQVRVRPEAGHCAAQPEACTARGGGQLGDNDCHCVRGGWEWGRGRCGAGYEQRARNCLEAAVVVGREWRG